MNIAAIIEDTVTGLGYELVDLEASPRGRLLRVFIDCPESAARLVTVEDCETVSNQLTRLFEVEGIDYDRLEVSSPGMDRVLKRERDFERFCGQEANIRLRVPVNGQRNFKGVLAGLAEGRVSLETPSGVIALEFDQIERARLVPKF